MIDVTGVIRTFLVGQLYSVYGSVSREFEFDAAAVFLDFPSEID